MAKWNLEDMKANNDKKGNNSIYDLSHHGDEVIVSLQGDKIKMAMKIQTGITEFRSVLMTFDTQTQMERLLPSIMKGLHRDHRG